MDGPREAAKRGGAAVLHAYRSNMLRRSLTRAGQRLTGWVVSPDFWYGRYPHTFLERRPPEQFDSSELPRRIWCFWVGDNSLSPARTTGLASIRRQNPDIDVELITPCRLSEFLVPEHPLHPAYEYLSYNHRSDYLRAYFLHHHGGGYADIKPLIGPWAPAFDRLTAADSWVVGPPLTHADWAGNPSGRLEVHLRRYHSRIPSGTMLIAKSHTDLTAEWLREIERRLDYYEPALRENPGGVWGQDPAYPIEWMALQGNIFQPLCLKYRSRVLLDASIMWDVTADYR